MGNFSDMDQLKNFGNFSAAYGYGFAISNSQTFKECLLGALQKGFPAWGNHEVLKVDFEPTVNGAVAFTATMSKGSKVKDKLPIRGVATVHTTISHHHNEEIDFHSYILIYWELDECESGQCMSSIPAGKEMGVDYAPCTRCSKSVDRRG